MHRSVGQVPWSANVLHAGGGIGVQVLKTESAMHLSSGQFASSVSYEAQVLMAHFYVA